MRNDIGRTDFDGNVLGGIETGQSVHGHQIRQEDSNGPHEAVTHL